MECIIKKNKKRKNRSGCDLALSVLVDFKSLFSSWCNNQNTDENLLTEELNKVVYNNGRVIYSDEDELVPEVIPVYFARDSVFTHEFEALKTEYNYSVDDFNFLYANHILFEKVGNTGGMDDWSPYTHDFTNLFNGKSILLVCYYFDTTVLTTGLSDWVDSVFSVKDGGFKWVRK